MDPRRDAVHIAVANNFSTTASLFISFLVAFVVLASTTPSIAWHVVLSLGLLIVALIAAVAGGWMISFDTNDAASNPATTSLRSVWGLGSLANLYISGICLIAALVLILPYIVCQQFDFAFQQAVLQLQLQSQVNAWSNNATGNPALIQLQQQLAAFEGAWDSKQCHGVLSGFLALALVLPFAAAWPAVKIATGLGLPLQRRLKPVFDRTTKQLNAQIAASQDIDDKQQHHVSAPQPHGPQLSQRLPHSVSAQVP